MSNMIQWIKDGGVPAYAILILGIFSLALIFERIKTLYFEYALKTDHFMSQIRSLLLADKVEEALTFCSANQKAPLAHVIKGILERSDRDEEALHHGLEISLSEVIPNLGKRLNYLSMLANVSTLMGLLGTITGLIMAFSAVSFADPSQKQIVLAQGISMAMNTTALGLSVAIPIMVIYSFLHSRQNKILEEIAEHSTKVIDLLLSKHFQNFSMEAAFPSQIKTNEQSA